MGSSSIGSKLDDEVDRTVFATAAAVDRDVYRQMEDIRGYAQRNNAPQHGHAVLLYKSGWFLHWIEAPAGQLHSIVQRIAADPHHRCPRVLHHSHGRRYLFDTWTMVLAAPDENHAQVGQRIDRLRAEFTQHRQFAPQSVIRRVVEPMRLAPAQSLADPDNSLRIGVCAARPQEAHDFVRWLGQHKAQPVTHQRWAGRDGPDMGQASVDFMHGDMPVRATALPRRALDLELLRILLPDWHYLLLLLSGDPGLDQALILHVCRLCAGNRRAPELLGVAPDLATHEAMLAMADACNLLYTPLPRSVAGQFPRIAGSLDKQLSSHALGDSTQWPVGELEPVVLA